MPFKMPDLTMHALRGAAGAPPAVRASALRALVVGGGGRLGSAVLAEALSAGGYAQVAALVEGPLASALRGFVPLRAEQLVAGSGAAAFDTAFVVFERERFAFGRDDAFVRPDPLALVALAGRLRHCGVQRLLVVTPHAPSMLPAALRSGFASRDEAAVAALDFAQLVLLRPAQGAAAAAEPSHVQRFVGWWLSQLRWMVPQSEQALRAARVAQLVVQLARLLPGAAAGVRVVPPGLLWQAAQSASPQGVLEAWLNNGAP